VTSARFPLCALCIARCPDDLRTEPFACSIRMAQAFLMSCDRCGPLFEEWALGLVVELVVPGTEGS
jgi:hypothetical protein